MTQRLGHRLRKLEIEARQSYAGREMSRAIQECAMADLAKRFDMTVDEAVAHHGAWSTFCYWSMLQPIESSNQRPKSDISAQEAYMAMLR